MRTKVMLKISVS